MTHVRRHLRMLSCVSSVLIGLLAGPAVAGARTAQPAHGVRAHAAHREHGRHAARHRQGHHAAHRPPRHRRSAGVPHTRVRGSWAVGEGVPVIQVNGDTLSWNAIPGAGGYEFVEKVPGEPDAYSHIDTTSITPPTVPGKMVWFSVRPASSQDAWATETAIDYPAGGSDEKAARAEQSIGQLPFQVGLVSGADVETQLPFMVALGARTARVEFSIDAPVSLIVQTCREYALDGVRPLLLASFEGRLPSAAEAQKLAAWAAAVGPGGSAWAGGEAPNGDAVTDIEFGNETNYGYQFSDQSMAAFARRARTYALRARSAALAIRSADPAVGLLAIADTGELGSTWISGMFHAVPNLGSLVAGWTVHPYGPDWAASVQSTISATQAAGAPANLPIWITEWGLSTDGGSCVSGGNYGFSSCLTYDQAADTLQSTMRQMRARFGSRIAAFYLFQASDQDALGATNSNQGYFGALQQDGSIKGSYTAAVEADLAGS